MTYFASVASLFISVSRFTATSSAVTFSLGNSVEKFACTSEAKALVLDYGLFFAVDPSHRGIVVMQSREGVATALVAPDHATVRWTP